MKLLTKTSLLIITASIFIFWIGNSIFFYVAREMISSHINTELMTQMTKVTTQMKESGTDPGSLNSIDELNIIGLEHTSFIPPEFSDTVLFNISQQKYIPHRALRFSYRSGEKNWKITIYKSLVASDKLVEKITLSSIGLVIAFIFMIFILNRFIFRNVWSTFSRSLEKVEKYDIKNLDKLSLPDSEIDEFDKLNRVLLDMVERLQADYQNLKELTANTSHEIQTPLAIISGKAELLLQSGNLSGEDLDIVNSILVTAGRLSKLNQSLLLIAKIENNQFEESAIIDLGESLEGYISNIDILLDAGGFTAQTDISACRIKISPVLLEVLISNLLKNAISHGTKGSEIKVGLGKCIMTISNFGDPLPFPSHHLFRRFIKDSGKQGSSGIGLELVRKVCNYYDLPVDHSYVGGVHTFRVDFSGIVQNDRAKPE